ncbi:peptide MFS transporter [Filimonas effusa]|uniref:MFS transporter n=1 Tax=Filimonas effusa TaxID=2508721 RepID=A0A4Q1D707_9BACT|nr:peptide MFS transporter [Filimonas effusa]RXK83511.1 MFS transporter [Filimonas effusa]
MNDVSASKGHPKGLYILFATEMWERFNYYGMRAVLILFMTKALLFDKAFASNLYGSYTSLVYLTPLIGGFVADRYWGNKRSIIAGGILMAIGEFILFFCGSVYASAPGLSTLLFFSGLGFMIAGNGFFKPNISSLVGQLYPKGDRRIDAAYTIFYMGINVGGALGPILCGTLGDTGSPADFKWAFLVAGIGMTISVLVQKFFHNKYVTAPGNREKVLGLTPAGANPNFLKPIVMVGGLIGFSILTIGLLYLEARVVSYLTYLLLAAVILIAFMIFSDKTLSRIEKERICVIFIAAFFVIFFWSAFEQAGASLTFFADEQTDRSLGLNISLPIVYIVAAAGLFGIVQLLRKASKNLASEYDKALRFIVFGLLSITGVAIIGGVIYLAAKGQSISMNEVPASFFQSLNSVFVVSFAPIFAWLWVKMGKREPGSPTKMAIGLLLLSIGYLWIAFGVKDIPAGTKVSMIWLTGMYALHTCGELCLSPIGLSMVNKLAPLKFGSLLMAVWFLANAVANKLAGILSSLYPDGKPTRFLGYEMTNTYDFFILFVVMSGVAALVLFLITKKLQKMMHFDKD